MTPTELVLHPELEKIIKTLKRSNEEKAKAAYNLFTLSSYTSHLENFHSDVIASFLNPKGLHNEDNKFLILFIKFLNEMHANQLSVEDFWEAEVLREKGRIDIWIRSKQKDKGILIENKINNAGDRDKQLDDYYTYSDQYYNCKVCTIVYLSLDGYKTAPVGSSAVNNQVKNIGAFTNSNDDLVNGWLIPCLNSCTNQHSSSLIFQYVQLLRYLASKQLYTSTMDTFYAFVDKHGSLNLINELIELKSKIPEHRTDKFVKTINNHAPFLNSFRYKPNYHLYDNFKDGQNNFKIDVYFMECGNASILFWNPPNDTEIGRIALQEKLEKIKLLDEFEVYNNFKYAKFFRLGEYPSMEKIDIAIASFTNKFMEKLRLV